uniref:CNH domain-containing protein n=1 Tax=Strigamia maritima TaxID=126957 RepID=T1J114_STRMM
MSVRAFDLVPAFERLQVGSEKCRMRIKCIECCGKIMYIGTAEGFILQFMIEEVVHPNGKISCVCTNKAHRNLGMRKPVDEMKAASALNRILVNSDSTLMFLNMFELELVSSLPKIKGITTFCINENPNTNNPFSIQVCVAKRKQIMIYNVSEDKSLHLRDISLAEPAAMDGLFVCAALTTQYVIINCETTYIQELIPYDSQTTTPLVKRISKEEFLLNGPNALGIFVTAAGVSERPPIQWMETVCSAAYSHPYILAADTNYITIYSILDQQLKQNMQFEGGQHVGNFDGKIYATSQNSVYVLVPVSWEKQVQALLEDERISEALELCKHANKSGMEKEQYLNIYQRFQQQAAFIHLSRFHFEEAKELFLSSNLDIRELISLYPNLLPISTSASFTRSSPALHNIADINQMCRDKTELIIDCKAFLMSILEDTKSLGKSSEHLFEINIALLKLYAEIDSSELTSLIVSLDVTIDCREAVEWLERYERYNAVGHLYQYFHENEKALQVWVKIAKGEYNDESFEGLGFLVEFLANLRDHDLVLTYADFVLSRDEVEGVKIFINRPPDERESDKMGPDLVLEFLHRFPIAVLKYLEYLVFKRKIMV